MHIIRENIPYVGVGLSITSEESTEYPVMRYTASVYQIKTIILLRYHVVTYNWCTTLTTGS